ncbi:hypothetical protein PPACK8108_LOCUS11330 [Phakopsora pachyrhizi]|uniref:Protein BIG1 n=1 Tax=Phakopsora pachyrhizi TaxID=170000 RepID=A0AAV0AZZ6_PHAPC|nr:hypothetical protein PPACK8108_LOCUS11330 [Phakopsora pachyrhizi]
MGYLKLFAILILGSFLTLFERPSSAFQATSSLLAWTNAPGVSLADSAFVISAVDQPKTQLTFESKYKSLCPLEPSSLQVYIVSNQPIQQSLKHGFISPEISKEYNSVPSKSRLWIHNRPNDGLIPELLENWTTECRGRVFLKEIISTDDVSSAYGDITNQDDGALLVVFVTAPSEKLNDLYKRQLSSHGQPSSKANPSGMPSSKTGVFWRYSFLSDYIIIGALVLILLFIPPVLLGSYALMSIEASKGLKTKMVGSITEVKGA